jgi:F-type H+-transporting ATPase subunit delta
MSDITTIARPYAKAIFEHAQATRTLKEWSNILQELAQIVARPEAHALLSNPAVDSQQQVKFILSVLAQLSPTLEGSSLNNFIQLLVQNKRVLTINDIYIQFEILKAEQEKMQEVRVISFNHLTPAQEKSLIQSLSERLQRQISINVTIDKTLMGGAIIYAGDLVIDGSVRGRLNKLGTELAA